MAGEHLDSLTFDARGALGDRAWAVITQSGKIGSGKTTRRFERVDRLLHVHARRGPDGIPLVSVPDQAERSLADPLAARSLSDYLGQPVTFALEGAVRHFDVDAVHLLSLASLAWVRQRIQSEDPALVDARRFRPNIVVDVGHPECQPIEETWQGKQLAIGSLRLRVNGRAERCTMVADSQADLVKHPGILREIARGNDACLGVYASVLSPGTVQMGDEIHVLD